MPKEEIASGLKQAVEKGESLEQAKQTFINAGYNPKDIEEASSLISKGTVTQYPEISQQQPPQPQTPTIPAKPTQLPPQTPTIKTSQPEPPQPQLSQLPPQSQIPQKLETPITKTPTQQQPIKPTQLPQTPAAKPKKTKKLVILVILFILLLILLGLGIIFRDNILDFLARLF